MKHSITILAVCVLVLSIMATGQVPQRILLEEGLLIANSEGDGNDGEAVFDDESFQTEAVNDDAVNAPLLFTMTAGSFETAGRVLLFSTSNDDVTSLLNQEQAENSAMMGALTDYMLCQNYPNPFNPNTTISFELGTMSTVTLKVYNMLGQELATLIDNERMDEGEQSVNFDASHIASGVYFYRLVATPTAAEEDKAGNLITVQQQPFISVMKMLLLR